MKFFLNIIFLFFVVVGGWSQGQSSFNYDQLLEQLEKEISKGQKRTLRDLGSLLDKKQTDKKARAILKKSTFFTEKEIGIEQASKVDFLSFYYDNEKNLLYSELLNGYYLTPIENRKVDFKMRPSNTSDVNNAGVVRRYFKEIDDLISAENFEEVLKVLGKIKETNIADEQLLFKLLQDPRLFDSPEEFRKNIYQNVLNQLKEYTEIEIAEIALQMWEGGFIEEAFAHPFLTLLTNCSNQDQGDVLTYFQNLIDSLGDLNEIRGHGYQTIFNFKLNFFHFSVDYYGKILGLSDQYPWIKKNALLDLKRTQHPRALFYIAAHLYRNRHLESIETFEQTFRLLRSLTNVEIGVTDQKGKTTFSPDKNDETALLNYLLYWASSYSDYEWDENRNVFTNKLESLVKTQSLEKLFRRLNSRNDSVAINSFLQLTHGDPVEVNVLAKKYRQLLRNHNASLPSLKYGYLEQLTLLTNFCIKNNYQYQANKKLQSLLNKLLESGEAAERYAIENELIEVLNIDNITVLEYWACLHEGNLDITFSTGRILDWFYSKNWEKLIKNNDQLRFYLKKSYLFESIGVSGVCNAYLNKFDISNKFQQKRLQELEKVEADEDIINQISLLLAEAPQKASKSYNLDGFLEEPLIFERRELKTLPAPSLDDLGEIIESIRNNENHEEIKKFFSFLRLHPKIEFVPKLFQLINDERVIVKREGLEISVADHIIPIVENVYAHNFPRDPKHPYSTQEWKALWERDSINYEQWASRFFELKLDSLSAKSEIDIDELNQLTESPLFEETHKASILGHLGKVRPLKNIRRLNIEHKLSVEKDLKYFQNFFLSYKELDDIPKLFDINEENAAIMLNYLAEKSASFNFSEKGSFYNSLFRTPWLSQYLNSDNVELEIAENIREALEVYLNESDFLSEFEEQTSTMHMVQIDNIGKPLEEKLLSTLQMDADVATKNKVIDEIIAGTSFEEIRDVMANFNAINNVVGDGFCAFLHRDFGLPIFSIKSQKYLDELLRNHTRMSEYEFYLHYLKLFGVDFLNENGALDFQKINDILRFDIISPFVGKRGGKRDDYSYGIIKLLELKFETRLGFHEKLNESQTFYSFSSSKRAQAWIKYLQDHKLIDLQNASPPSFNKHRKEM